MAFSSIMRYPCREVDDPLVIAARGAIRPIREAAAGETPGRNLRTLAFVFAMGPQNLARGSVQRDHIAPVPGRGIKHPIDHQRRRFQIGLRRRAEIGGAEGPGRLQLGEIAGVDLIQRRITGVRSIAAIAGPVRVGSVGRALLGRGGRRQKSKKRGGGAKYLRNLEESFRSGQWHRDSLLESGLDSGERQQRIISYPPQLGSRGRRSTGRRRPF